MSTIKHCNMLLNEAVKSPADFMTNICQKRSWQMGDLASKWGDCLNPLWSPVPVYFPVPINFLCACFLLAHCKKYDGLKVGDLKVCFWIASILMCSTPDVFPHLVLKSSENKVTGQEPPGVLTSPGAFHVSSWATRALKAGCQWAPSGSLKHFFKAILWFLVCSL